MLKRSDIERVARNLGESEQAVSRGINLSAASIFGALSRKSGDSETMRQVVDLASRTPANALTSAISGGQFTNPRSPMMAAGERLLTSLFGSGHGTIANSISRETGLRAAATSAVMALGAHSVLSYLGSRVRDEGMTATGLSSFLQREGANLKSVLPAGFNEALPAEPPPFGVRTVTPITSRALQPKGAYVEPVTRARSMWLWLLPLLLILLGILWFAFRPKPVNLGIPNLGSLINLSLPDGTTLHVPENGVEGRLLVFIRDPNRAPDSTSWFDFDRLLFDSGTATLQPQSQEQLQNIAAILKAYPNVHMRIGGYTDNTGSPDQNLKLSTDRANNVMAELVRLGVSQDRLDARGYGQDHPVADNSTEEGRAKNRRISMLVTQK
jgi:outer membrane protein OmpA-like peptidoglycan-associated protein